MDENGETYFERLNGADLYFEVVAPEEGESDAPTLIYLHGGPGYNALTFRDLVGERLAVTASFTSISAAAGAAAP